MTRSDERGIAVVAAMLMVVLLSAIGSSLMVVARTETLSSLNYKTMSQARYAAESAVHSAANHLIYTYVTPGTVGDPLANYDLTVSPVEWDGEPVVLSSHTGVVPAHYPIPAVQTAFSAATQDTLNVQNDGVVSYAAHAVLVSMHAITDAYGGAAVLQTWEITGVGIIPGAGSANVEVSAVIERQVSPAYRFAAFATSDGCDALSFAGGASTNSYDSTAPLVGGLPVFSNSDANVGTNGNLDGAGSTTHIGGSLSTPRAGVGACTTNNVTAASVAGWATVEDGLVQLPQPITFPTPPALSPMPPTSNNGLSVAECAAITTSLQGTCTSSGSTRTITPAPSTTVVLGNVNLTGGAVMRLNAGTYIFNSIDLAGGGVIEVASGPVVIKIAGVSESIPVDMTGGGVVNASLDPSDFQLVYGGTGEVRMRGGAEAAAVIYAPNAVTSLAGGTDFYGAIITGQLESTGGSTIHYDRNLMQSPLVTAGNFTMNTFTWKTYP